MIFRMGLLVAAVLSTSARAADKETPSTVDIQKHNTAIGNAIGQVGNVEQLVGAYRQRANAFPSSNAEAGVKPGGALASADVKSIDVTANGVIVATLTGNSGVDGGQIVFTPNMDDNPDAGMIRWVCTRSEPIRRSRTRPVAIASIRNCRKQRGSVTSSIPARRGMRLSSQDSGLEEE